MKIIVLAAAACCVASIAIGADLPSRRAPVVYVPPVPVFTWTGVYIGGNAGYAFDNHTDYQLGGNGPGAVNAVFIGARPSYVQNRSSGFAGGGQIGYNFELKSGLLGSLAGLGKGVGGVFGLGGGGLVGGLEADAAYTDLRSQGDYFGTTGLDTNFRSRLDFLGTVRGRLGIAFDRLLIYGTGGFAYGGARDATNYFTAAGVNNFSGSSDTIRTGVAYGGGVEYAIPTASFLNPFHSSAVTLKAEYLRYNLGTTNVQVFSTTGNGASYGENIRNNGNLVRGGINYKFDLGGTPAPVVARY